MEQEIPSLAYAEQEVIEDISAKQYHANRWKRRAKIGLGVFLLGTAFTSVHVHKAIKRVIPSARDMLDDLPVRWYVRDDAFLFDVQSLGSQYSLSAWKDDSGVDVQFTKSGTGFVENYDVFYKGRINF